MDPEIVSYLKNGRIHGGWCAVNDDKRCILYGLGDPTGDGQLFNRIQVSVQELGWTFPAAIIQISKVLMDSMLIREIDTRTAFESELNLFVETSNYQIVLSHC
ncbi:MAG TPA: hypothetical protein PK916_04590 [Bacteroidota bacterium]|nr:hypothetical protein [Bacteroidota bacterium]